MMKLADFTGRWRITSMELWDTDVIDLVEPAFIEFDRDRTGRFGFIAVEGWMDCREATRDGQAHVEFTWEGSDEGDQSAVVAGPASTTTVRSTVASSSTSATTRASTRSAPSPSRPADVPDGGPGEHHE